MLEYLKFRTTSNGGTDLSYEVRDEEHCTCPWPTITYLCPIDPSVDHYSLELFAVVPLHVARQRIIEHMLEHHNPGWNMYLTLALRDRAQKGMPQGILPASVDRLLKLSGQTEIIEPNTEMLIALSS